MKQSDNTTSKLVLIPLMLICMAVALLIAADHADGFAEWYSVNIYSPLITGTVGRLAGIAPFSVAEAAVCILPFIIIADVVR